MKKKSVFQEKMEEERPVPAIFKRDLSCEKEALSLLKR